MDLELSHWNVSTTSKDPLKYVPLYLQGIFKNYTTKEITWFKT